MICCGLLPQLPELSIFEAELFVLAAVKGIYREHLCKHDSLQSSLVALTFHIIVAFSHNKMWWPPAVNNICGNFQNMWLAASGWESWFLLLP